MREMPGSRYEKVGVVLDWVACKHWVVWLSRGEVYIGEGTCSDYNIRREVLDDDDVSTLTSMNNLGDVLSWQGKYEQACA
jgi:hypothetical protein